MNKCRRGPLYLGDIEDYKGSCHVMCPWHSYMFDLATGKNEIGLRQEVYQVKVEMGNVYVKYHSELSLKPYDEETGRVTFSNDEGKPDTTNYR
ncbi:hypothetical protein KUTeg_010831 [Tegillarca granosa]|uniref:Rieske domain-containing protein n=1 Tax=Tegillarca granosa TaxID=220873 RepID=A0ABQ9F4G6_TEGGR|nr:hypothetical protein KUTeg_010831 [Tegillarca granosa]